jgi:hypothetical protein
MAMFAAAKFMSDVFKTSNKRVYMAILFNFHALRPFMKKKQS